MKKVIILALIVIVWTFFGFLLNKNAMTISGSLFENSTIECGPNCTVKDCLFYGVDHMYEKDGKYYDSDEEFNKDYGDQKL